MRNTRVIAGAAIAVLVVVGSSSLVAELAGDDPVGSATASGDPVETTTAGTSPTTAAAVPASEEIPIDSELAEVTSDIQANCPGLTFDEARAVHRHMDLGMDVSIAVSEARTNTFGGWVNGACGAPHVFLATDEATSELIRDSAEELGADIRVIICDYSYDELAAWESDVRNGQVPELGAGVVASMDVALNRVVVWPTVEVDPADVPPWAVIGDAHELSIMLDDVPE